jgi:hypothetical protein
MRPKCICGCGSRGPLRHHVIYRQACRWAGASIKDQRNLVAVAKACHDAHHDRTRPLALSMLPDRAYGFAAEVLGRDRAYNYLGRRYAGTDPRHDALLTDA